jgi:hypothetical protein
MAQPTIDERMRRKLILMCTDEAMITRVRDTVSDQWTVVVVHDLEDIGEWQDVLLHRFLLLDLDEIDAFDPLDVIRVLRMQYQINLPVFCFGGDQDIQDEMRLSRADRFFDRDEMITRLPDFLEQYRWGE